MSVVVQFQRPQPQPVTVILRPVFSITATNTGMDVRVVARPAPPAAPRPRANA